MLGAINHIALTVSDLERTDSFFSPLFEFLGYSKLDELDGLSVWVSRTTGTAVNLWEAKPELRDHRYQMYAPGFHHLAFNAESRAQVNEFHELLRRLDVEVLNEPAEYDYAPGYYAVFFKGPDEMKFELTHIPVPAAK